MYYYLANLWTNRERLEGMQVKFVENLYSLFYNTRGKVSYCWKPSKFNQEARRKYKELLPHEKEELNKESELCVKMGYV